MATRRAQTRGFFTGLTKTAQQDVLLSVRGTQLSAENDFSVSASISVFSTLSGRAALCGYLRQSQDDRTRSADLVVAIIPAAMARSTRRNRAGHESSLAS